MTNTIAIWLALLILGFFILDHFVLHLGALEVIMRGLIQIIAKLAFWR